MIEIRIDNGSGPMRLLDIKRQLAGRHLHVIAGGMERRDSYKVEFRELSEAHMAVTNLNCLEGVRAAILREVS